MDIEKIRREIQGWRKVIALRKVKIMYVLEDGPKIFQEIEEKTKMRTGTLHGHLMTLVRISIVEREKRSGVYEYKLTEIGINWLAIINHTNLVVEAKSKKT